MAQLHDQRPCWVPGPPSNERSVTLVWTERALAMQARGVPETNLDADFISTRSTSRLRDKLPGDVRSSADKRGADAPVSGNIGCSKGQRGGATGLRSM